MKDNYIDSIVRDGRRYADLKVDQVKLKTTEGLSVALSQVCSILLIVAVLAIVLGLLAYALLQWLNVAIGAPWGTFIVCGVFAVALLVLCLLRKRLFRNAFVKLFIDVFYGGEAEDDE